MKRFTKEIFGEFSRYALFTGEDRFGDPCFMVEDAEHTDELTGLPAVIRQASSREEAMAGLA